VLESRSRFPVCHFASCLGLIRRSSGGWRTRCFHVACVAIYDAGVYSFSPIRCRRFCRSSDSKAVICRHRTSHSASQDRAKRFAAVMGRAGYVSRQRLGDAETTGRMGLPASGSPGSLRRDPHDPLKASASMKSAQPRCLLEGSRRPVISALNWP